jgi:citrate synthase
MAEVLRAPRGLEGVAVADTKIGKSGADGSLIYRGYAIQDLFEKSTFEETAFLILNGRLPSKKELAGFASRLRKRSHLPPEIYRVLRTLPRDAHPMDVLRTAVSALGTLERNLSPEDQKVSIISKMPSLVVNGYRVVGGRRPVEPKESLGQGANMLYMLRGREPSPYEAWVMERVLILYMEHDLNASAFTVRVVASTLADVYSACTAGLAALKGPLHGGANEAAMQMLARIGKADGARAYVQQLLDAHEKVMGFGHRVYKKVDPRAQLTKQLLRSLVLETGKGQELYDLSVAVEKAVWDMKKLPANVDFYAAPVFHILKVPIVVYTPIFASSRIVGWVAHYNEQLEDNRIYRPDSVYVGEKGLKYVPIAER